MRARRSLVLSLLLAMVVILMFKVIETTIPKMFSPDELTPKNIAQSELPEETENGNITAETTNDTILTQIRQNACVKLVSDESFASPKILTAASFSDYQNSAHKASGASITCTRLITLQVMGLQAGSGNASNNSSVMTNVMEMIQSVSSRPACSMVLFKVVIPSGSYYLDYSMYLYSNTWLSMKGVTFYKGNRENKCMARAGAPENNYNGYSGMSNIILEGGTWDVQADLYHSGTQHFSNLRFGHDENIIVANVTFAGAVSGHHLELCGAKDVSIVGCAFRDYKDTGYVKGINRNEAIQIDITNGSNLTPSYANYDDTISSNVVIYSNTFSNVNRGVGSHSAVFGKYYDNIVIQNNTFTNVTWQAVNCQNYRNCAITGNRISNCGGGIEFNCVDIPPNGNYYQPVKEPPSYRSIKAYRAKTVISDNTISVSTTSRLSNASGIYVHGGTYNGSLPGNQYEGKNFWMADLTISNNTITSARDSGIMLAYTTTYTISGNTVTGVVGGNTASGSGIYLNHCKIHSVSQNSLSGNTAYAIYAAYCTPSSILQLF